jgi:hypothetical protein
MVLGLRLLQIDGEHIYSGHDLPYKLMAEFGMFFLFLSFLTSTISAGYLAKMLSAMNAMIVGVAFLVVSAIVWSVLIHYAAMDSWTTLLIVPPLIGFLSGALLVVVGGTRVILKIARAQPH